MNTKPLALPSTALAASSARSYQRTQAYFAAVEACHRAAERGGPEYDRAADLRERAAQHMSPDVLGDGCV
ncbi:hypothetical protein [Deinococcus ruber]|uniref:Uncharacterized protein n=1 Tax=Deinococcus ruber TaxID=1848197 RepID=A0A918C998_9DEIO|nr:hypothetical protein [Deinococcus ruber]GGR11585.1 hypothetical protein GCM10008957_25700 [Deinococcus ruber]